MQDYRSLTVWKRAHALALGVYQGTSKFKRPETWSMGDQLRRAATSIPTNVVEGRAKGTDPEFRRYLRIALGSASELEYLLLLARDLGFVAESTHLELSQETTELKRMLFAFTKRLDPKRSVPKT
ncbi:MAG TPA: four helix bundle protein [Gemmatimonadales bacterium]|nr:four helix bundle protein [Gemmatimonadales bacterium]